jgi:hypothetical protein
MGHRWTHAEAKAASRKGPQVAEWIFRQILQAETESVNATA